MSYIIAVDLALANAGIAVIDITGGKRTVVELTTVVTTKQKRKHDLYLRCIGLSHGILNILQSYLPHQIQNIVVEIPAGSQSASAASAMASATGVMAALESHFPLVEFVYMTTTAIKRFVGSPQLKGAQRKGLNLAAAEKLYPQAPWRRNNKGEVLKKCEHEADALLLAHLFLEKCK